MSSAAPGLKKEQRDGKDADEEYLEAIDGLLEQRGLFNLSSTNMCASCAPLHAYAYLLVPSRTPVYDSQAYWDKRYAAEAADVMFLLPPFLLCSFLRHSLLSHSRLSLHPVLIRHFQRPLFDWYDPVETIIPLLAPYLCKEDKILEVGCGNSPLAERLFEAGYTSTFSLCIALSRSLPSLYHCNVFPSPPFPPPPLQASLPR